MKRILMVDDVATNLRCATEILKENYAITAVKSGKKALELLEENVPDLLMLDINMPDMNGFEVFERVKAIPELSGLPVVFLTAETNSDMETKGRQMGAVDFIRKPYEPEELTSRIGRVFETIGRKPVTFSKKIKKQLLLEDQDKEILCAWANAKEIKGYFVLFNFENFDRIDDALGHFVREEIFLKIRDVVEAIPGSGRSFCHIRENVFGTCFESDSDLNFMKSTIRRIIAELEFEINEAVVGDIEEKITVSAGIALKPEDGNDYETLFRHADKALYFVQETGKRRYHFYCMKQEESHDGTDENEIVNLMQLKYRLESQNTEIADSQKSLQTACHVISHYWDKEGEQIQIIFFGIEGENVKEKSMELLGKVITNSLRKGDVAVKCGRFQYIVVLLNASAQNGEMVAKRIKSNFEEKTDNREDALVFEMKNMQL